MDLAVHGADLLLDHLVCLLLILEHLLHQVKFALHESTIAQRRVNF